MASGGPRVGTPGASYSNRSDLNTQPIRTATGQDYGKAGEQRAQQAAVPLPQQVNGAPAGLGMAGPGPAPGGLYRDSAYPDEHAATGLDQGLAGLSDDRDLLEALFELYPTAGLSRLLESM